MKPADFEDITKMRTLALLKEHGTFLMRIEFKQVSHTLYAVADFYVEFVDYGNNTHDVYAYYCHDPLIAKFLWRINLKDYL